MDDALVDQVLERALRRGADEAELYAESTEVSALRMQDTRLLALHQAERCGVGIRVRAGRATGFAHTTDLSLSGLMSAADSASAAVSAGAAPRAQERRHRHGTAGASVLVRPNGVVETVLRVLDRIDRAARDETTAVCDVTVQYDGVDQQVLISNTAGLRVRDHRRRSSVRIRAITEGKQGNQTGERWLGKSRGLELFEQWDVELLARQAAQAAEAKQRGQALAHGVLPVVMGPGAGAIVVHEACGHGLEADLVQAGASVYRGRVGEQVASELVTVVDDPTLPGEHGSFTVDDEGVPGQRTTLIENGMLKGYLWDRNVGREAGQASTGNGRRQDYAHLPMVRMTNTFVAPGRSRAADVIRDTGEGLYVAGLGGGEVNTTTGDFVFSVTEGYLIENGELTHPVLPTSVIGNGPQVLRSIDAVADDGRMWEGGASCGKVQRAPIGLGQPTLRIPALTLGER